MIVRIMNKLHLAPFILACSVLGNGVVFAARLSDVRGTVHNLSNPASTINYTLSSGPLPARTVMATSEQPGFCVFCHTAHTNSLSTPPMWNKAFPVVAYETYTSSSMDTLSDQGITELAQPDDRSKMCLSCHDGTVAIGTVDVFNGLQNQLIDLSGTSTTPVEGAMPASASNINAGASTGFTRRLGIDLRNDHPISVNYTASLAIRDGELREVDSAQKSIFDNGVTIGPRADLGKHKLPLFGMVGSAQVQCPTCHDPHIRDDNPAVGNQKFLRLNRFQEMQPVALFSEANDIICLACHDKGGNSWSYSAHANSLVGLQTYLDIPGNLREFPANLPVWKASCLNCHDTHTVEGARRLLREGTDSLSLPKAGGNPAVEETCFQCHTTTTASIITYSNPAYSVPDIKSDYDRAIRMPIRSSDQVANSEVHDIGGNFDDGGLFEGGINCTTVDNKCGADFVEKRSQLGATGNLVNRHAECTDCHNPHRVVKFKDFRGNPLGTLMNTPDAAGTHKHDAGHTNIASGVLRGMTGVEPEYSAITPSFEEMPTGFTVKRGDPGVSIDVSTGAAYVTREYQVCLKCHSNFGYADNNLYPIGNRPNLSDTPGGGTPNASNLLTQFTNQAKEFQAPITHKGEVSTTNSGAFTGTTVAVPLFPDLTAIDATTNNHRSWHPVMDSTGRTPSVRGGADPNLWFAPWNGAGDVGNQTMYCSDCHGSTTDPSSGGSGTVVPVGGENGNPWGPHGSSNNFILKGVWDQSVGRVSPDALCFRCHDYDQYANPTPPGGKKKSGFSNATDINLHVQLSGRMAAPANWRCTKCHEAVSHGWKNKAFLVNLNDVGQEAGVLAGAWQAAGYGTPSQPQPYYMGAWLRIRPGQTFRMSGDWTQATCESAGQVDTDGAVDAVACGAAP